MSTTMPKAGQIDRKWYVIDAAGKPLGRVAAQAAVLLRGKHKVTFAPHVDCGDHVIIINCKDAVLTGGKAEKKYYYRPHRVHRPSEGHPVRHPDENQARAGYGACREGHDSL